MKKLTLLILCIGLGLMLASARAQVIMDQIGANPGVFTGGPANTSQQFEPANTAFNVAVVDNFVAAAGQLNITTAEAAFLGFSGFISYSSVNGYYVQIYSSLAAANGNLTGDIASVFVPAGSATVTTPFSGDATSALISLSVNIVLPSAGTYYLSIIADNSFASNGALGPYVTASGLVVGANPGDANAFQENPNGGFGFPGNQSALLANAAYRLTVVPEPSTYATLLLGAGVVLIRIRKRRLTKV